MDDQGPGFYQVQHGVSPKTPAFWLLLLAAGLQRTTAVDPCQIHNLNPGGVGSHGNITSTGYPQFSPPRAWSDSNCRMIITACAACHIKLYFNDFTAPACHKNHIPLGSCVPGCDHIMVFEPDYAESSSQYIFDDSTVETFTTVSNRLTVIVCHSGATDQLRKFRISFEIQEKSDIIYGEAGGYNESGFFTSPNFPHGYSLHNEVYTYLLQNTDPNGLVRLSFDDWNLSPNSKLTVYFHNDTHPDIYLTRMGSGDRPFVLSSGPSLFIKFETGEDLYSIPYVGFKARYMFVNDPYWPDKPYTVHDSYFYSRYGGQLSFPTDRCWNGDRVDCIWVITKYRDHNHDQVALNIQSFFVVPNLDSLEIRTGNSSEGNLVGVYDQSNLTGSQFVSTDGFYLRLRATCSKIRQFQAVFTSFTNATDEGVCSYYYHFHCGNGRCIAKSLVCDGIDHCGDSTDEQGCTTTFPTTKKDCATSYVCRSGRGWYCLSDRCNGFKDCEDGTDERNCFITEDPWTEKPGMINYYRLGTYIPIGLAILLMTIIACILISCCARRKRNMLRRRQHSQNNRGFPTISGSLPGGGRRLRSASETHLNINVEIQHYPDSPPSYEEVLSANQSTYSGINNMAFSMSDSSDQLPPPPPYSPRDENPYPGPIPYTTGGLYIPNTAGGMFIGMPPNPEPCPPPPPVNAEPQPGVPITGFGDLTGNSDIPEVHSSGQNANRRSRDAGRRRSRNDNGRQQQQRRARSSGQEDSINNNNSAPESRSRRANNSGQRSNSSETPPSENATHNRPNALPTAPRVRRGSSSTSTPIQNFVHNLISRAARQSNSPQPPATLALDTTNRTEPGQQAPAVPSAHTSIPEEGSTLQAGERSAPGGTHTPAPPATPDQRSEATGNKDNPRTSPVKNNTQAPPPLIHSTANQSSNGKPEGQKDREEEEEGEGSGSERVHVIKPDSELTQAHDCDTQNSGPGNPSTCQGVVQLPESVRSRKVVTLDGADDSMTYV